MLRHLPIRLLFLLAGSLSVAAAAVANDDFTHATPLSAMNGSIVSSNVGATMHAADPLVESSDGGASVWWMLTAPETGTLTVDTHGSDFDTVLGIYTGTALASLVEVAANDDTEENTQSAVTFPVVKGYPYLIMVAGYDENETGIIRLNWRLAADNFQLGIRILPVPEGMRLQVSGQVGKVYRIDATNGLDRWRELGVASPVEADIYGYLDTDWNAHRARFYRAVEAGGGVRLSGSLDYGAVAVGGGTTRILTIENTGTIPLRVHGIDLPTGFSGGWSGVIPVGGSQRVAVTFDPTKIGSFRGDLTIQGNASGGGGTISIEAQGANPLASMGFTHSESQVSAIIAGAGAEDPGVVVMRSPEGYHHAVIAFRGGSTTELIGNVPGRPSMMNVDGHRMTFTNYTANQVTVHYQGPAGQTATRIITIPQASSSAVARYSAEDLMQDVDATLAYFADITETHWVLNLYREYLAEPVYNLYMKGAEKLKRLVETDFSLDREVGNPITFEMEAREAGRLISAQSPEFFEELRQVDPDAETTAGIKVTQQGLKPDRNDWDAPLNSGQVNAEFTTKEGIAGGTVFAEMNPDSPSYVPPLAVPTATARSLFTRPGSPLSGTLSGTGTIVRFIIVRQPSHGSLQLANAEAGSFTYTPAAGYVGPDTFDFVAENRGGQSAPATVTINVEALAAIDMMLETGSGQAVSQNLAASGAESFELVRTPANGTVTLNNALTGAFTYRPAAGYVGQDSFSFVAIQGTTRSSEGVVTIRVLNNQSACAAKWMPILPGKWKVVEHPHITSGSKKNWTLEFVSLGGDMIVTQKWDWVTPNPGGNTGWQDTTQHYFIYDTDNADGSSNCALSYNKQANNEYNFQLVSGNETSLVITQSDIVYITPIGEPRTETMKLTKE